MTRSSTRRRPFTFAGAAIVALLAVLLVVNGSGNLSPDRPPSSPGGVPGVVYYVSPEGSDANQGTSPGQAWRTVARVNAAVLAPGDGVLFQGGATFSDAALMPAHSGAAGAPIVYGSYGSGQATISQGVWFATEDYLTFDNLGIGTDRGFQGGSNNGSQADHITIQRCTIQLSADNSSVGVYSNGNDWTIADNTVRDIGNSGMLLNGDSYLVTGNTIDNVGLDPAVTYHKHGIYLMVSNATITDNRITNFENAGISPRFRDSTITGNYISGGAFGIAFFEYDQIAGTSRWADNTITGTSTAAIYVNGGSGGRFPTNENFIISGNAFSSAAGQALSLEPQLGSYFVSGNGA